MLIIFKELIDQFKGMFILLSSLEAETIIFLKFVTIMSIFIFFLGGGKDINL